MKIIQRFLFLEEHLVGQINNIVDYLNVPN